MNSVKSTEEVTKPDSSVFHVSVLGKHMGYLSVSYRETDGKKQKSDGFKNNILQSFWVFPVANAVF